MECNRDEAIRAKAIADEKLDKKDFAGARKFALKALSLYPPLEGISQMLATIEAYVASENKIGGEVDWYAVLGVNPTADEDIVKKQYRKLALMLHPDKNKSAGADGAFKLICEAWSLLSDKYKRIEYNQRRFPKGFQQNVSVPTSGPSAKGFQQNVPMHKSGPSAAPHANGLHSSRTPAAPKTSHGNTKTAPTPAFRPTCQRTDTFWTICKRCKMHYEYLNEYLNKMLLCPNCHVAFHAIATTAPFNNSKPSVSSDRHQHQNPSTNAPSSNPVHTGRKAASAAKDSKPAQTGHHSFAHTNFQQDSFSGTASAGNLDSSIAAKAANIVQQAHEKMKRERDSSQPAAGWGGNSGFTSSSVGEGSYKRTRVGGDGYHYGANVTFNRPTGTGPSTSAPGKSGFEADRMHGFSSGFEANRMHGFSGGFEANRMHGFSGFYKRPIPNSTRELLGFEVRNMLMEKARKAIHQKLDEWTSQASNKTVETHKSKVKEDRNGKGSSTIKSHGCDPSGNVKSSATKSADKEKCAVSTDADDAENPAAATMSVPDPDFHDFDQDRTENSFEENEVWAAYDDQDGMPRFYAFVNKLISRNPFKLRINFLNSRITAEFGTMKWVECGFHKTCGEFRHGRLQINKSINSFSHKVKFSKGRGVVNIFPCKGDVWALYRNWSADWNRETPEELIYKYDMVVVLDDYREEQGLTVTPLSKVPGFKTVFLPHPDQDMVRKIPKEEMFRFSHQVPHYMLSGKEAENVPKGSLELDPAATPLELVQVSSEAMDGNAPEDEAEKEAAADPKVNEGEAMVEPSLLMVT